MDAWVHSGWGLALAYCGVARCRFWLDAPSATQPLQLKISAFPSRGSMQCGASCAIEAQERCSHVCMLMQTESPLQPRPNSRRSSRGQKSEKGSWSIGHWSVNVSISRSVASVTLVLSKAPFNNSQHWLGCSRSKTYMALSKNAVACKSTCCRCSKTTLSTLIHSMSIHIAYPVSDCWHC